jgi:hypothetical protein
LLLRFAGCMREHGLTDFPDPKADGMFLLVGTNARRGDLRDGSRSQEATANASGQRRPGGVRIQRQPPRTDRHGSWLS